MRIKFVYINFIWQIGVLIYLLRCYLNNRKDQQYLIPRSQSIVIQKLVIINFVIRYKSMPKYVLKEDVEKGLIDLKKPLNEQPAYKEKYAKDDKQRNNKKTQQKNQNHQQYEQKPHKKFIDKRYYIDWRDITLETEVPETPKKVLPKPDREKFHNQLNILKQQRQDLNHKKTDLRNQLRDRIKDTKQTNRNGAKTNSKFSAILNEKHNIKNNLEKQLQIVEARREDVKRYLQHIKFRIQALYNPSSYEQFSKEALQYRKNQLQSQLSTANIDKKQEAIILNDILKIGRLLITAKPEVEFEAERYKLNDQYRMVKGELDEIYGQWKNKLTEVKSIKRQIAIIYEERKNETAQFPANGNIEELKIKYDQKIHEAESQADQLTQKIQALKSKHFKELDSYDQQQQLLNFIEKIKSRKEEIKNQQIERQKRLKEREQKEKRRQKQQQQWEKQRQQRKKEQEQRRKAEQQKRQKLKSERQAYINGNPHRQLIDLCKFLIDYCESFKPENKPNRVQQKPQAIVQQSQITDKIWQKQLKKGACVLVSKKNKVEQENQKRYKKDKRKTKQKIEQSGKREPDQLSHQLDMFQRFDKLNLIPPQSLQELQNSIKQLRDKIEIFNKPSQEEIQAYRETAGKQFDIRNGIRNRDHFVERNEGQGHRNEGQGHRNEGQGYRKTTYKQKSSSNYQSKNEKAQNEEEAIVKSAQKVQEKINVGDFVPIE